MLMKKDRLIKLGILAGVTIIVSLLVCFVDKAPIGPKATVVGMSHINGFFRDIFKFSKFWYVITNLLGYLAILLCLCFDGIGALQLWAGKGLKKVDRNIVALGCLYVVVILLYVIFEKAEINCRPVIMPGETDPEASFPSSHTMLALTVFCSAPWVGSRYLKDANIRKIFTIVMYVLAAVMVVGRLLSGVHWFTDIIASILISATLLYAFRIVLDFIKPKKKTVRK